VQLPKGMPEKSFTQLKRVQVRRQALAITVSDTQPAAERPSRPRKEQRTN
jgi:ATP-dependent RNA helicase DeaD